MFCPHCGTQLPNNASFCPECGSKVSHINSKGSESLNNPETVSSVQSNEQQKTKQKITCPSCGCKNCEAHYKQNVTSTGGGYGCLKGGLGYLLAGPFGLLCGFCGKSQKTTTTNTLVWVCPNCGKEFQSHDDIFRTILSNTRIAFGMLAVMGFLADLFILLDTAFFISIGVMLWVLGALFFPLVYFDAKSLPQRAVGIEISKFLSETEKNELDQVKKKWGITVGIAILLLIAAFFA